MEWINDGQFYCGNCDITFKVYAEGEEPYVQFCPMCASKEIESVEEE